jgi:uncharacterized LabA/DUF88 family protein
LATGPKAALGVKTGAAFCIVIVMSRTIVYIDGLNLYYQALKWSANKWINLEALASAVLPPTCDIRQINYYVADVSGRVDPDAPRRQQALLRALKSTPIVAVHKGNFLYSEIWTGLVYPFEFRPLPIISIHWPRPTVGMVHKTEEKGSDVNLGAHLVRDAFQGKFDTAAILTNDTDLKEPLRIVVEEVGLPVILLTPINNPARSLVNLATEVRHIRPYLGPSQFPNPVILPNGQQVYRPPSWATAPIPRKKRRIRSLDAVVNYRRSVSIASATGVSVGSIIFMSTPWYLVGPASFAATLFSCAIIFGFFRRFRGY